MIQSDAIKPSLKFGIFAKLPDGFIRGEKYFLGRFAGIVIVSDHAIHQIKNFLLVASYQDLEQLRLAALDPLNAPLVADVRGSRRLNDVGL